MEPTRSFDANSKAELYALIRQQLISLTRDVPHLIANLANASALLFEAMEDINWAGFYLLEQDVLVLGPFQGKAACIEIPWGRGVCGTAAEKDEPQLVPDVHLFPGHIACDSASASEVVLPLHRDGKVVGVLDIDSPSKGRFTQEDLEGLLTLVPVLEDMLAG